MSNGSDQDPFFEPNSDDLDGRRPRAMFKLRDLPLPARLVLSLFLISVGVGYASALVQLHFQHAQPGELLPTGKDAERIFNGKTERPKSKFEVLLEADEKLPFNGGGQMRAAFKKRSDDFQKAKRDRTAVAGANAAQVESDLHDEREGERNAVIAWARAGASKDAFDNDVFELPEELAKKPITREYLGGKGVVKIHKLIADRCTRCHQPVDDGGDPEASKYPLRTYEEIKPYVTVKESTPMELRKLAQTTHVHLLGFSMLYGLTGLILAFSSYPGWLRAILCPLPLLVQLVDIGCWWLARIDPMYAHVIMITGGIVAVGLMLHIVLSLLNMYGVAGKLILLLMFVAAAGGGFYLWTEKIDPFLSDEKPTPSAHVK